MATHFHTLLGADELGHTCLSLLSSSLAHATYVNYDSNLRQLLAFCIEEYIHPLHATPATMVRFTIQSRAAKR